MHNKTLMNVAATGLLGCAMLWGMAPPAAAGPGTLSITGTMAGSIGDTAFTGANFTMVATFRWAGNVLPPDDPIASYPAMLQVTIDGVGTVQSAEGDTLFAVIYQPEVLGSYDVEIQSSGLDGSGNLIEFFAQESLDQDTQILSLTDPVSASSSSTPFSLLLRDGETLQVTSFDTLDPTAAINVPEPTSSVLLGVGLAAILPLRRVRRA